jgi:uncharacterized membrane protein (UPF0127 family)
VLHLSQGVVDAGSVPRLGSDVATMNAIQRWLGSAATVTDQRLAHQRRRYRASALAAIVLLSACGTSTPRSSNTDVSEATATSAPGGTIVVPVARVVPAGFPTVEVTITKPDGTICERCMLLADTPARRERGLMGVTSLGGYDGMLFRYDVAVHTSFWMKDTVTPLQIAFLDADGRFMQQFDMQPCTADPCATYGPSDKFLMAVETFAGQLATVGLVPGSTVVLGGPCPLANSSERTEA